METITFEEAVKLAHSRGLELIEEKEYELWFEGWKIESFKNFGYMVQFITDYENGKPYHDYYYNLMVCRTNILKRSNMKNCFEAWLIEFEGATCPIK